MKKVVSAAAACLMVFGGAFVSAPAAPAYPAGSDPAVTMVGSNRLAPRDLSAARAFNYKPGCTATMRITRAVSRVPIFERTRRVLPNGSTTFAFQAPARPGRYVIRVGQDKTPGCVGFSATTRFRVVR